VFCGRVRAVAVLLRSAADMLDDAAADAARKYGDDGAE